MVESLRAIGTRCAVSLWRLCLLIAVAGFLGSCANPMPPSGGPVDKEPPTIVASTPGADQVNVEASSLRIEFSEYVNPQTFPQAFSITPAPEGRMEFRWRGRTVEVNLPEPFRPNTTYIITIDTNLRDANGVALSEPIVFAFSTGPVINRGQLAGQVVDPVSGKGVAGIDVYAYARADSSAPGTLPERPDYRTQTDTQGRFSFQYLNEQPYFVVAVQDQNRNRIPDPTEPRGVPPVPVIVADTSTSKPIHRWVLAAADTTPPVVQRARPLSNRRLEIRFNEPVSVASADPELWVVEDSVRNVTVPVQSVYALPASPQQVYLVAEELLPESTYRIRPGGVVDSAGNTVREQLTSFTGISQPDTVRTRFLGFVPDTTDVVEDIYTLRPGQPFGVRFNEPPDTTLLRQAVTLTDTSGTPLAYTLSTRDGTAYFLTPTPPAAPEHPVQVRVNAQVLGDADTVFVRTFRPLSPRELGELSGYIAAPDATGTVVVELYSAGAETRTAIQQVPAGTTSRFIFSSLPEGHGYRLRAFLDHDGDTYWDPGRISPYQPAEPLVWSGDSLRVRARWEEELSDTLRIPNPGF